MTASIGKVVLGGAAVATAAALGYGANTMAIELWAPTKWGNMFDPGADEPDDEQTASRARHAAVALGAAALVPAAGGVMWSLGAEVDSHFLRGLGAWAGLAAGAGMIAASITEAASPPHAMRR